MKSLPLVATTAAALAFSGTSLAAPRPPSKAAAVTALRKVTGPVGPVSCIRPGGGGVWACDFARGRASIVFDTRHKTVRVYVTCLHAGTTAKNGCR